MAEGPKEGDEGFSFMDKVKLMMYGEQEKEAFLIEKKEKEEKKKARKLAEAEAGEIVKPKKQGFFGKVTSYFSSEPSKEPPKASPETPTTPTQQQNPSDEVTTTG